MRGLSNTKVPLGLAGNTEYQTGNRKRDISSEFLPYQKRNSKQNRSLIHAFGQKNCFERNFAQIYCQYKYLFSLMR